MMTSENDISATTSRQGFFLRNIRVLMVAGLTAAVALGTMLSVGNNQRDLAEQTVQINALEERLSNAEARNAEADEANTYEALGITETRLVADQTVIENTLLTAFSWDDARSYEQARELLVTQHGLDPDGDFLTDFMPPAASSQRGGQTVYYIDEVGVVFSLGEEMSADVVRVSGTDYAYLVIAEVEVSTNKVTPGTDGSRPTRTQQMLLRLTVDGEGEISDISGVQADDGTRSAG